MVILTISRNQALAFRQQVSHLHKRLPHNRLVEAAFAGLQDSAPRSAILALHARVHDVSASDWEDHQLVQIWGPRGADYVVPKKDQAVFTLGRLPRDQSHLDEIEAAAQRVAKVLRPGRPEKRGTPYAQSRQYARDLRLASMMGGILIRWDGSRISWRAVDPPRLKAEPPRLELARRFLGSLGPSNPAGFAWWSGGTLSDARHTFRSLERELSEVKLAGETSWTLKANTSAMKRDSPIHTVRLLPPGDPYLGAADRKLLVSEKRFQAELWPKSVWPGALFVHGELAGTWRRQQGKTIIHPWRRFSSEDMEAVDKEVQTIPIESTPKGLRWEPLLEP